MKPTSKPVLAPYVYNKVEAVIKSCRTFDQLNTARKLLQNCIDHFETDPEIIHKFLHCFKVQGYWVKKQLFPGDKVVTITNQDEPATIATIVEPDWSTKSSPGICYIRNLDDGKIYYSFAILIPYESLDQVYEINSIPQPDRWNKYCLPTNQIEK